MVKVVSTELLREYLPVDKLIDGVAFEGGEAEELPLEKPKPKEIKVKSTNLLGKSKKKGRKKR